MTLLARYNTGNIEKFLNDIDRYTIGLDDWFNRVSSLHHTETNYPPYNLIKEDNSTFRLEIALAGFKKNEITVSTEDGKLCVEAKTDKKDEEYVHQGLAKRAFVRYWTLTDDVEVKNVRFEDGLLTIDLKKIIPESKQKKVWL